MNNPILQSVLKPLASVFPAEKIVSGNIHRLIFPFWHAVSDTPPPHLSQLYRVPAISDFLIDLDFLMQNFRPASPEKIVNFLKNNDHSVPKQFFPTFDDGLSECYFHVAPILKQKGIPAAFFINPEFVDNRNLFHRHKASLLLNRLNSGRTSPAGKIETERLIRQKYPEISPEIFLRKASYTDHQLLDQVAPVVELDFQEFLKKEKPYMSLEQIRELQADGFLIGAHGTNHREFFLTTETEMKSQIAASLNFLKNEIRPPLFSFAFPFTDFRVPDSVFEQIFKPGMFDLSFGTAGIKDDKWPAHLQRIPMETGKFRNGKQRIRTEFLAYFVKKLLGKQNVQR